MPPIQRHGRRMRKLIETIKEAKGSGVIMFLLLIETQKCIMLVKVRVHLVLQFQLH